MDETRFDRLIRHGKNNPVLAWLLVTSIVIGGVAGAVTGARTLVGTVAPKPGLQPVEIRVVEGEGNIRQWLGQWFPEDTAGVEWGTERVPTVVPMADGGFQVDTVTLPRTGSIGGFPVLDLVVRNTANDAAVVTMLRVQAEKLDEDRDLFVACSPLAPSAAYHVLLDPEKKRQVVEHVITHAIEGNRADRFAVIVGQYGYPSKASYEFRLEIQYNNSRQVAFTPIQATVRSGCGAGPGLQNIYVVPEE